MKIVPFGPITMVRPPGCPLDQISALKAAGSLILSSGIFSTVVTVGGTGWPFRLVSCLLATGLDLSIALVPCEKAGLVASTSAPATPPAINAMQDNCRMQSSLVLALLLDAEPVTPRWPCCQSLTLRAPLAIRA